jgi:hypothetical protein
MPIKDLHSLRDHLQEALELEHATIPPYLCALYSIPEGSNREAASVIRSVVMEEMLHMILVANVMNAVGGKPVLAKKGFIKRYPGPLPHSDDSFSVELLPFSERALDIFLKIERPAKVGAPPQPDRFHTIGQFYEAIEEALTRLTDKLGPDKVFTGIEADQVPPGRWYYGGGGEVVPVRCLESALRALREVTDEGEGLDHTIWDGDKGQELAHYFRFAELRAQRGYLPEDTEKSGPSGPELPVDFGAVAPMRPNPRSDDYRAHPAIYRQMVKGNRIYTRLLRQLQAAFTGTPEALRDAVPIMYEFRYQAEALMRIPSPLSPGTTVGPSFEFDQTA